MTGLGHQFEPYCLYHPLQTAYFRQDAKYGDVGREAVSLLFRRYRWQSAGKG
jgi:hypothetical protein